MKFYILALLSLNFLSACSHSSDDASEKKAQNYQHTFTSIGYASIGAQSGKTFDLKMLNAIKASKLEAYKEMAEQVHGVFLTSENNIKATRLTDDGIQSQVTGLVKGARVLKSYHEGDVYITELVLDMQTLPFLDAFEYKEQQAGAVKVQETVYY